MKRKSGFNFLILISLLSAAPGSTLYGQNFQAAEPLSQVPYVDVSSASAQIQQLENYNASLRVKVEELTAEVEKSRKRISALKEEIRQFQDAQERVRPRMLALEESLTSIFDEVVRDQIIDALARGKSVIDRLSERIGGMETTIVELNRTIETDLHDMENARIRMEENERTIAVLKEAIQFTLEGREQIVPTIEEFLSVVSETEKILDSPAEGQ